MKPEKVTGEIWTRRQLLKVVVLCYNPLKIISPFLLIGKLHFQESMNDSKTSGWDDTLLEELREKVKKWQDQIGEMPKYKIDRWLKLDDMVDVKLTLHVYSDASTKGYGFVAYRLVQKGDQAELKFLFSKDRKIPMEDAKTRHRNSVPKFELVAATAAAKWAHKLLQECR